MTFRFNPDDVRRHLRLTHIRSTTLLEIEQFPEITVESIKRRIVAEMDFITDDEELLVQELVDNNRLGMGARYRRNPTQDDLESWKETAVRRKSLVPEKRFREKGCENSPDYDGDEDGAFDGWVTWPEIVVSETWPPKWMPLYRAWIMLKKKGMSWEFFKNIVVRGKRENPNPEFVRLLAPGRTKWIIRRALKSGLDIISEQRFTSRKGTACREVVFQPSLGEWEDTRLRLFCRLTRTPLAIRVVCQDDDGGESTVRTVAPVVQDFVLGLRDLEVSAFEWIRQEVDKELALVHQDLRDFLGCG